MSEDNFRLLPILLLLLLLMIGIGGIIYIAWEYSPGFRYWEQHKGCEYGDSNCRYDVYSRSYKSCSCDRESSHYGHPYPGTIEEQIEDNRLNKLESKCMNEGLVREYINFSEVFECELMYESDIDFTCKCLEEIFKLEKENLL